MSWPPQGGPQIQNFSIPAGNAFSVVFDFSGVSGLTSLANYTVYFDAYEQSVGVPTAGVPAVISKSSLSGQGIDILTSPLTSCVLFLDEDDTVLLLRNYYFELAIVDESGGTITPTVGTMTVLGTEVRV